MNFSPDPSRSSPRLPWEVIERTISHSCDSDKPGRNPKSIRNFSLTCRALRPRSFCFLVSDATFHSRDQVFDFCDLLRAKPHLKRYVRSISVNSNDFAPVPLLRILPNLSRIELANPPSKDGVYPHTVLNQSSSRWLGTHIHTLCLTRLYFKTCLHFCRVLSAFPRTSRLVCRDVCIEDTGATRPLYVATQRLSQQLCLLTVRPPACPQQLKLKHASLLAYHRV